MAFNGSGTFSRTNGTATGATAWATTAASDPKIRTSHHDTHDQDLADGLSNCICKDGQTTITANIPMAGYKLTGMGLGVSNTDSAAISNISAMALLLNGTTKPTANIDLNSKKIINLGTPTATGDAMHFGQFAWSSFSPTITCSGSLTLTSLVIDATYFQINKIVFFICDFVGNLGGSASDIIYVPVPTGSVARNCNIAGGFEESAGPTKNVVHAYANTSGHKFDVFKNTGANWSTSGTLTMRLSGFYEIT